MNRRMLWGTAGVFVLLLVAVVWMYQGGKVAIEDILREDWTANRAEMESVAGDLLQRKGVTGIAGKTYRGTDLSYLKIFKEKRYMSAEKAGPEAVLFVREKKLGFDRGLLYVRSREPPALEYARKTQLDPQWYVVSVKTK